MFIYWCIQYMDMCIGAYGTLPLIVKLYFSRLQTGKQQNCLHHASANYKVLSDGSIENNQVSVVVILLNNHHISICNLSKQRSAFHKDSIIVFYQLDCSLYKQIYHKYVNRSNYKLSGYCLHHEKQQIFQWVSRQ